MAKSIFTKEYKVFLKVLRGSRLKVKLSQVDLAARLGITQSAVSKSESGERRLDIIELRRWCEVLGKPLPRFVADLERSLRR